PSSLSVVEILGFSEVHQILVICQYFDLHLCAFQVMGPFVKTRHHCKHFFVIYFIILLVPSLCSCDRMPPIAKSDASDSIRN
ncbi:hypothetical protein AMATHDRAFT_164740, partial [Amanita thiersii Skay4041]